MWRRISRVKIGQRWVFDDGFFTRRRKFYTTVGSIYPSSHGERLSFDGLLISRDEMEVGC